MGKQYLYSTIKKISDTPTRRDRASSLISPPRAPLQVMNAVATRFVDHLSAQSMSSNRIEQLKNSGYGATSSVVNGMPSSPARFEPLPSNNACVSTPVTHNTSYFSSSSSSPIGRSPALERVFKKISKKNGKGETPLHTAAIRGKYTYKKEKVDIKTNIVNVWIRKSAQYI